MATTRVTARRQLYDEVQGLGRSVTLSTPDVSNIKSSDPYFLEGTTDKYASSYRGLIVYRPDRSAGDQKRVLNSASVSAGVATITHYGPDWSTAADTNGEILVMDPDELNRIFQDALEMLTFEAFVPLYHGPADADMQGSAHGDWDDTSASFSKQTTATEVYAGARSGLLALSGAGGYTQSAAMVRFGQGDQGVMFARAKADTGTGTASVRDQDGNALVSVDFTQEAWLFIKKDFTLATDDEGVLLRMAGSGASDAIDVQDFWVVKKNETYFPLGSTGQPLSWLTERMKVRGIARGVPLREGREADTWLAGSMRYEALREGVDYQLFTHQGAVHPYAVQILDESLLADPLFVLVEMPYSEPFGVTASFSADTDSTNCPINRLMALAKILLAQRKNKPLKGRNAPDGTPLYDDGKFPGLHSQGLREMPAAFRMHASYMPQRRNDWGRAFQGF